MTQRRDKDLTHHEELRYDYLLRNLAYLNEREQQEYKYLKAKKDYIESAYRGEKINSSQSESVKASSQLKQSQSSALPSYPKQTLSRSKKRAQKPVQGAVSNPQKVQQSVPKSQKPKRKIRWKRIFKILGVLLLLVFGGMIYAFFKGMNDVTSGKSNYSAAVTETFNGVDAADGTNILILGSDQRVTQDSTDARTDTIMVMNMGGSDGKIKLASFMRDTLVNIEGYSSDEYAYDLKLNTAFTFGEENDHQGAEYIRQVLKNMYDIDIKYYVMIDFETFAEAIDTLFPEGVEIDAQFNTVNGEVVTSVEAPNDIGFGEQSTPYQTIYVGNQRMNGQTLLNYARFRSDDLADAGRVQRQQQVIETVISQIKDPTKLFTGSAAIGKIYAMTSTNISYSFLLSNGLSAVTSGQEGIEHISVPEQGDWVDDYDMYGGMGLLVDFEQYKQKLAEFGLR
ncbi:LCP family protein [Streptococcus caprae]|uniref:Regulatory protein MsrR n=1 Tax=Streptococcus caprae TaxID=1640501 RepID=A0ABV8CXC5_9STRE